MGIDIHNTLKKVMSVVPKHNYQVRRAYHSIHQSVGRSLPLCSCQWVAVFPPFLFSLHDVWLSRLFGNGGASSSRLTRSQWMSVHMYAAVGSVHLLSLSFSGERIYSVYVQNGSKSATVVPV